MAEEKVRNIAHIILYEVLQQKEGGTTTAWGCSLQNVPIQNLIFVLSARFKKSSTIQKYSPE